MYRVVVHFVQPNGCTPGGWGRGERAGEEKAGLDNVQYLCYNGGAGLPHNSENRV